MSKKTTFLISLIISVVSVIIMAMFGTIGESTSGKTVEEVFFIAHDTYTITQELDLEGNVVLDERGKPLKIIKLEDEELSNSIFYIYYDYTPLDAYAQFGVSCDNPKVTVTLDEGNKRILVFFKDGMVEPVKITIIDALQNLDEIKIIVDVSGGGEIHV